MAINDGAVFGAYISITKVGKVENTDSHIINMLYLFRKQEQSDGD